MNYTNTPLITRFGDTLKRYYAELGIAIPELEITAENVRITFPEETDAAGSIATQELHKFIRFYLHDRHHKVSLPDPKVNQLTMDIEDAAFDGETVKYLCDAIEMKTNAHLLKRRLEIYATRCGIDSKKFAIEYGDTFFRSMLPVALAESLNTALNHPYRLAHSHPDISEDKSLMQFSFRLGEKVDYPELFTELQETIDCELRKLPERKPMPKPKKSSFSEWVKQTKSVLGRPLLP